jgi:hypothetical protein
MKKESYLLASILFLSLTLAACGGNANEGLGDWTTGLSDEDWEDAVAEYCWVVPALDGTVDSWAGVDTESDRIRVGYVPDWFGGKDSKGILTFDTTKVPEDATILGVWMLLGIHKDHLPVLPLDWSYYIRENLIVEVAGPWGFGGLETAPSHEITGYDYFAEAVTSTSWVQDPVIGAVHLYNPDLNPSDVDSHVNRGGLTQIRIAFKANPLYHHIDFQSGDSQVPMVGGGEEPINQPFLYIIWK